MARPDIPAKLNICMVAKKFPMLGRASDHGFLWPIAKKMAEHGHNVTVLSWKNPQGKKEINQDNIKAYFLGEAFARSPSDFPFIVKQKFELLHKENPFHIVHSIDNSGLQIGIKKRALKIAMAYDVEATSMSQLFSILAMAQESPTNQIRAALKVFYRFLRTYFGRDRKLLNTADGMFTTSPQQKIVLERHYLFPDLRTFVVPYGLDIGELGPKDKLAELRERLQLPINAKALVTVTDMQDFGEMKNLLRAYEKVAVKKPSSRLIIVGHGPLYKEIEFEMLNLALGGRVIFTGPVTNLELPNYISLADVYVDLSSRNSGFEPSMIEAMAQKKVIIGSELSPISTIVDQGKDGFLIRPADINELSKILLSIFNEDVNAMEVGQQASQKVHDIFDTEKMASSTLSAYRTILETTGFYKRTWDWL